MANNNEVRKWMESIVLPQNGCRVLHYRLHDTAGDSLLAAVGAEISPRKLIYSISADYLRVFGCTDKINTETRWKSRKSLVHWLQSLTHVNTPIFQGRCTTEIIQAPVARYNNSEIPRTPEVSGNTSITWCGDAWICSKNMKHYAAFCRSGVKIYAYSFVCVMGEGEEHPAYIEDLYESHKGYKKVRVRWLELRKDIEQECDTSEVIITYSKDVIRAESINSPATILSHHHFKQCLKFIPQTIPPNTFFCRKVAKGLKLHNFSGSQLPGYSVQPVLASLISHVQESTIKDRSYSEPIVPFRDNDIIELLSEDSESRGCWYRCSIMSAAPILTRVRYHDKLDDDDNDDGAKKLEEYVPSQKVADPDKLGMRHAGRLIIRPKPSEDLSDSTFEVGDAVDAWRGDGWWEGVVIGCHTSSANNLQVFFPGKSELMTIERENMRISRDWIDGKWMNIRPNPNILEMITSVINKPMPNPQALPNVGETITSAPAMGNMHRAPRPEDVAEQRDVQVLNNKKRLVIRYSEEQAS